LFQLDNDAWNPTRRLLAGIMSESALRQPLKKSAID
jgi:hypothetical protein